MVPVAIPEGVKLGERIMVAGFDQAPLEEVNPKKKVRGVCVCGVCVPMCVAVCVHVDACT